VFGGLVGAGTKALGGNRFSLVNLFPPTFLAAYITFLIQIGAYGGGMIKLHGFAFKREDLATFAFGVFVFGVLLRPFQAVLVQFLEGYWSGASLVAVMAELAVERHRRRLYTASVLMQLPTSMPTQTRLDEAVEQARRMAKIRRVRARASSRVRRYPQPKSTGSGSDDRLMPTMLGNALRDGEDTAGGRYGLDMMTVYPRMYPYLSPKLSSAISQQLDLIATTVSLCYVFLVATALSAPLAWRGDWWGIAPLITVALAILTYRGAIRLAYGHGILLATAFDLHRFHMLEGMRYPLPKTAKKEAQFNRRLTAFLVGRRPVTATALKAVTYCHPVAQTGSDSSSSGDADSPAKPDDVDDN
jgi:hypothetical protein